MTVRNHHKMTSLQEIYQFLNMMILVNLESEQKQIWCCAAVCSSIYQTSEKKLKLFKRF